MNPAVWARAGGLHSQTAYRHRDRPASFGVKRSEAASSAQGEYPVIVDPEDWTDDLMDDETGLLTGWSAPLYDRRNVHNRGLRCKAG
jgi:predicted site-specific integrase-resolvase